MAKMITVTEAGGTYFKLGKSTPKTINADNIKSIRKPFSTDAKTIQSVIEFSDGDELYVTETELQLKDLINPPKKPWWKFW